jgi:integrase
MTARRGYGSGSLYQRAGNWYGRWHVDGQRVKRMLGPVRPPGTREGLTRAQAERELRRRIETDLPEPSVAARLTVGEAGARLLAHLEGLGRKRSTLQGYESFLRVHLAPYFGDRPLARIEPKDVEAFIASCRRNGQSVKSTLNYVGLLHSVFEHAVRRGWVATNPCKRVEKPKPVDADADVRFLDGAELDALLVAVPADDVGRVERVLYLTAAMTGMRQGELLALRWGDVDWAARRIRVRRNLVRGEFGTPKSKRSSRSVPLADVVGGELDRLFQATLYQRDVDLVFCHPHTGRPLDRSRVVKRFKAALRRAGVREVRFHDLRHTFGTRMAAAGVPMRTLQEWMGHRDFKTTLIYADYMPAEREADLVDRAFARTGPDRGPNWGPNLRKSALSQDEVNRLGMGNST